MGQVPSAADAEVSSPPPSPPPPPAPPTARRVGQSRARIAIANLPDRHGLALPPVQQCRNEVSWVDTSIVLNVELIKRCMERPAVEELPTVDQREGVQYCLLLFPGMPWNGDTSRLAQERSSAFGVLAKVLEERRPEDLDSGMPERVGQLARFNAAAMAQLQADGNHELQLIVAYRRRSWAAPAGKLLSGSVRRVESPILPKHTR